MTKKHEPKGIKAVTKALKPLAETGKELKEKFIPKEDKNK